MRFSAVILAVCLVLAPARVFAQFDFPANPTLNQVVTGPSGQQFQWDGVKWVALLGAGTADFAPLTNPAGGQNNYAPLAAPTFTGITTVANLTAPNTATWTFPDGSTYTSAGHNNMAALGIGAAAGASSSLLNVTANTNGPLSIWEQNLSAGNNAQTVFDAVNDLGHNFLFYNTSSTYAGAGGFGPDAAEISTSDENGINFNTNSPISSPTALIRFSVENNLVGTFSPGGLSLNAPAVPPGSATVFRGGQAELSAGLYTNNSLTEVTGGWNFGARYNGTDTIATAETLIQDYAVGTGNAPGVQPETERSWAIFTGQTIGQPVVTSPRAQYVAIRPSGLYVEDGNIFLPRNGAPAPFTGGIQVGGFAYQYTGSGSGVSYTTNSTTFVPVDPSRLAPVQVFPAGSVIQITASASLFNTDTAANQAACMAIYDGPTLLREAYTTATNVSNSTIIYDMAGDNASHTISLQFASCGGAGTTTMYNSNGADRPQLILNMRPGAAFAQN